MIDLPIFQRSWWSKININWSQLHKIQSIKIISSMYIWIFIVPITAKFLALTEDFATVTVFDHTFTIELTLPFSWQLFYFAALSFAFATLLYQARCPSFIKDYPTLSAFEAEGKPEWHLRPYAEDIGLDYSEFKEDLEESMQLNEGRIFEGKEYLNSVFWNLHWAADKKRKKTFFLCFASYAIGFVLISIVFFQNFMWVIKNIT